MILFFVTHHVALLQVVSRNVTGRHCRIKYGCNLLKYPCNVIAGPVTICIALMPMRMANRDAALYRQLIEGFEPSTVTY